MLIRCEITNAEFLPSMMMLAEHYPKKYTPPLLDYKITLQEQTPQFQGRRMKVLIAELKTGVVR